MAVLPYVNLKASAINTELGRASNAVFKLSGASERALAEKPTGTIKFSDFRGKKVNRLDRAPTFTGWSHSNDDELGVRNDNSISAKVWMTGHSSWKIRSNGGVMAPGVRWDKIADIGFALQSSTNGTNYWYEVWFIDLDISTHVSPKLTGSRYRREDDYDWGGCHNVDR